MTNKDIAHYNVLLHKFGASSQQIQKFEQTHKDDTPLVKRMTTIKKQFIQQKRR